MDVIGRAMGVVTIPMAMLTAASPVAAVTLLIIGDWRPVAVAVGAVFVGLLVVATCEQIVIAIEERAVTALLRGERAARLLAVTAGLLPMLASIAWESAIFAQMVRSSPHTIVLWLCSYGAATGPWTAFALWIGSERRTLCGIRAYAGHLGYWLLTLNAVMEGTLSVGTALMLLPAALPITVGTLLAVADRDALRDVRI